MASVRRLAKRTLGDVRLGRFGDARPAGSIFSVIGFYPVRAALRADPA